MERQSIATSVHSKQRQNVRIERCDEEAENKCWHCLFITQQKGELITQVWIQSSSTLTTLEKWAKKRQTTRKKQPGRKDKIDSQVLYTSVYNVTLLYSNMIWYFTLCSWSFITLLYIISYHITSCLVMSYIISHIISYHISYHIISYIITSTDEYYVTQYRSSMLKKNAVSVSTYSRCERQNRLLMEQYIFRTAQK